MKSEIVNIKTITEGHTILGLPKPLHPLISIVHLSEVSNMLEHNNVKVVFDFYMVSLKSGVKGTLTYGRNSYDFSDGTVIFTKPNQVLMSEDKEIAEDAEGWMLFFHPDLIRRSNLGANMDNYSYFNYEVHEALHLSEAEQKIINDITATIEQEYQQIDKHSQKLIIANLELLLDYCNRYYDRQFYLRTNLNKDHVVDFEKLLKDYFSSEKVSELGMPSVKYCGEQLNMSPNYLSDLLKKETGKSAKEHIYTFVVNKAKNKLLATNNTVSEIAYDLGFEYPQHFSKLFKKQTGMSPLKYRASLD